ncbi:MAG: IS1634 family transposase [Elusimicrobiota bacterium]|nr:IS1634 family transposase [Elusimicrobiota bacterium]
MPTRKGPAHVAIIKCRKKGKTYQTVLLRRTYRDGKKVKHETLGNISHLPPDIIALISNSLKGEKYVPVSSAFETIRSIPHGHVAAVLGTLRKIGLETMIASRPSRERDLTTAMIVARIIDPCSKLATARGFDGETIFTTVGETLNTNSCNEYELYKTMDWLLKRQNRIEKKIAEQHLKNGSLILYDLTSAHYTGNHCALAEFGHSKDRKDFPQIIFGLICNNKGCPVAVEVFKGNMSEPKTLKLQIKKLRVQFGLRRIVFVGDRGIITEARIKEDISAVEGVDWITALRAQNIRKLVENGDLQPSLFDERDIGEISSSNYPGERLIVCRNPFLAKERSDKREKLLKETEKILDKIVIATQRKKRALNGKDKIGLRAGAVINKFKMSKHFNLSITKNSFSYERNEKKIKAERALDGIYVIRTSTSRQELNAKDTVRAYKNLSVVERAFRSLKTIDLKVRPIYHRLEDRVRAHVFLCMLSYYVEWHMRQSLKSALFDEEDKEAAEGQRASVVAPAMRSEKTLRKTRTKRTSDNMPAHSFQTMLKDLGTITKNRVRICTDKGSPAEFEQITTPTPLQRKIFELLGVGYM